MPFPKGYAEFDSALVKAEIAGSVSNPDLTL